eukprot:3857069-Prymnesium_polylepis.1
MKAPRVIVSPHRCIFRCCTCSLRACSTHRMRWSAWQRGVNEFSRPGLVKAMGMRDSESSHEYTFGAALRIQGKWPRLYS